MRPEELKKLLEQDESTYLEYKSAIDLNTKEGKAKFLKEVLSLANSLQGHAYLVIGVEDKKKTILGMEGLGEEQIQDVIKEWCRPVIDFHFEIVPLDGKNVGVMTIYSSRPPHTVKKKFGYSEVSESNKRPKEKHLEEHAVFVRRGSTIEVASPEEIVEMAQQRDPDGLDAVASRLDRIADWQEETAEAIYSQSRNIRNSNDYRDTWFAVPILIGLLSGGLIGFWYDVIPSGYFAVISSVVSFLVLSLYSIFSGNGITFKRGASSILLFFAIFWGFGKIDPCAISLQTQATRMLMTSFLGSVVGFVIAIVTIL